jgi:hypothetical protein
MHRRHGCLHKRVRMEAWRTELEGIRVNGCLTNAFSWKTQRVRSSRALRLAFVIALAKNFHRAELLPPLPPGLVRLGRIRSGSVVVGDEVLAACA